MGDVPLGIKVIAGLGNPGSEYSGTRHNIGFSLIDRLASTLKSGGWGSSGGAEVAMVDLPQAGGGIIRGWLVKPQTFMNRSGEPLGNLLRYFKVTPAELLVVHDEIDLPLGAVRLKFGGGDGGHNGLKSIVSNLGTRDFTRLRLGVGRPAPGTFGEGGAGAESGISRWVLGRFGREDFAAVDDMLVKGVGAVPLLLREGLKGAQQKVHT